MYAVVLAGGGGTRLWPLSTPERPKPFLRLIGDETLIQRSVARLAPLVAPEPDAARPVRPARTVEGKRHDLGRLAGR